MTAGAIRRGAEISPCGKYRYALWRIWDETEPLVLFVGLNPSTADATQDDPTLRSCIRLASRWGYGGLYMTNLFAYRSTDPTQIEQVDDPIGPENDRWIKRLLEYVSEIVVCWGGIKQRKHLDRDKLVLELLGDRVMCLGLTKDKAPRHPLFLKAEETELQPFKLFPQL